MNPFLVRSAKRRPGFALILVLLVVAILSLSTYTFCRLMVAENESAVLNGQQMQARSSVESGAAHVRYFLELESIERLDLGGVYDNPQMFQAQIVVEHEMPRLRGRFGVVAPALDDRGLPGGYRFGLQDESSRLNINALDLDIEAGADLDEQASGEAESDDEEEEEGPADVDTSGRAMLMKLPGMTIEIADAILDWIDEDDEPREYGAEVDFYSGMTPPYTPQNGPLKTIEELLLIRGVVPDLLFGRDVNRNGMIDVQESDVPIVADIGIDDGSMDFGWASYLTLFSQEKNVNEAGEARIYLNGDDMQSLFTDLSAEFDASWATYIVAYRQNGPFTGNSDESEAAAGQELDLELPGRFPVIQVLDLVGTRVQTPLANGQTVVMESPFSDEVLGMASYLPKLMDGCTVTDSPTIPGRVNINRAPRIVLMAIPGMTEEIADSILSQRDMANSEQNDQRQHETWILSSAIVTLNEMRTLMPYVTAGGDVFRAQIVGYFDEGEISSRAEITFDATSAYPRILSWRDVSHLGRGFARETLGIEY